MRILYIIALLVIGSIIITILIFDAQNRPTAINIIGNATVSVVLFCLVVKKVNRLL